MDYGAGNLPSVERAFGRLGGPTERCRSSEEIRGAQAIVLPGVGHFATLAKALDALDLRRPLKEALTGGTPFLGICLGMQALWEGSAEAPDERGLGVDAGRVEALPSSVKLPHMGWNDVRRVGSGATNLLRGIPDGTRFYFAHAFAVPAPGSHATGVCDYGISFVAVREEGSVMGVQFHPEKSGDVGLRLLRNFVEAAG